MSIEFHDDQPPVNLELPVVKLLLDKYGDWPIYVELPGGGEQTGTVTEAFEQCRELTVLAERDPRALVTAIQEGINLARQKGMQ